MENPQFNCNPLTPLGPCMVHAAFPVHCLSTVLSNTAMASEKQSGGSSATSQVVMWQCHDISSLEKTVCRHLHPDRVITAGFLVHL